MHDDDRPAMPALARGVKYMPPQWWVLSPDTTNMIALADNIDFRRWKFGGATGLGSQC
jgi:hypothetical protein